MKSFALIFIAAGLFIFSAPRPALAVINCSATTTDFAPWAAYNVPADGNCGFTEGGHEDCYDAATRKCWPFVVKKEEAGCGSDFLDIFPKTPRNHFPDLGHDSTDFIFEWRCADDWKKNPGWYPKTCCLMATSGALAGDCDFPGGIFLRTPPAVWDDPTPWCHEYYVSLKAVDNKIYCTLPAHYVTTAPLLQACQTAGAGTNRGVSATPIPSPGNWLGSIITGGAIAPGLGLGFFTTKLVPFLISLLFYLILSLSLIFLIIGGIMWIVSTGEKEALAKAKSIVTWAIIALVLALSSFIILNIVGTFFGSNLLGP